jgi:hypothetical protein
MGCDFFLPHPGQAWPRLEPRPPGGFPIHPSSGSHCQQPRPLWKDSVGETACHSPFLITASLIESQVVFVLPSNPRVRCSVCTRFNKVAVSATDFLLNAHSAWKLIKGTGVSFAKNHMKHKWNPRVRGPWSHGTLEPQSISSEAPRDGEPYILQGSSFLMRPRAAGQTLLVR